MSVQGYAENDNSSSNVQVKIPRRRLLVWAFFTSAAGLLLGFGRLAYSFLSPPGKSGAYGGVIDGGTLSELPESGGIPRLVPEGRFWLVHDDGAVHALHSSCTHLDCRFNWDLQNNVFVCPCHGSEFGRDGGVIKGPAKRDLDRFEISLVSEDGSSVRTSDEDNCLRVRVADLLKLDSSEDDSQVKDEKRRKVFLRVDTGRKIMVTGSEKS